MKKKLKAARELTEVQERRSAASKPDSHKNRPTPFWTRSRYRGEYVCEHGIGHGNHIHGCDGCCQRADYPLKAQL